MASATRTRAGMHYRRNAGKSGVTSPTRYADRDRAYRQALGLSDGEPLPRRIGSGR